MKEVRMYFIVILFTVIILFPIISLIFNINFGIELYGSTVQLERPKFSVDKALSGENQTELNLYFKEIIPVRSAVIRVGNQLRYSTFKVSTNNNIVIGNNDNLYEEMYITKELQSNEVTTDEILKEEIEHLKILKEKLNARGINMLLFLTPYKTEFYKDDIPWIYKITAGDKNPDHNDYERIKLLLKESNIDYFDSVDYVYTLKKQYAEEVFPKTGTHWSQLTGMRVAIKLISELEDKFEYDMPDIEIKYGKTNTPIWPDADLFQILNVYSKPHDNYYDVKLNVIGEGKNKPNILARGCSFMGQSIYHLINNGVVNESVYMENTFARINNKDEIIITDYADIDLRELMKGKDLIIFEANQAMLDEIGLGLMEFMYQNFDEIFQ